MRRHFPHSSRGLALVVVLWLVALLSLMVVSQTSALRTETVMVGNAVEAAAARHAAEAGVQLALLDGYRGEGERLMRPDGTLYRATYGDTDLVLAVEDEAGKVDLNSASGPLLESLFQAAGAEEPERLADAVLDWRDRDQLRRLNGAEKDDYSAAGLDYGPRDGPFRSLDELALVLGMTPAVYQSLAGSITLYSGSAGINPLVAPEAVLRLLPGISGERVDEFLALRAEGEAAGDFFDGNEALSEGVLQSAAGGRTFTYYCEARRPSGIRQRLAVLIRVPLRGAAVPGAYEILAWREDVPARKLREAAGGEEGGP